MLYIEVRTREHARPTARSLRIVAFAACLAACTASSPLAPDQGPAPLGTPLVAELEASDDDQTCTDDGDCGGGEACYFASGDCGAGGAGSCDLRPEICTLEYLPVCGCDRRTYGSACDAARAGASIRHQGPCADDDDTWDPAETQPQ